MSLSAPIPVLKSRAKKLSRDEGMTRYEALDRIARQEGFQGWSHLVAHTSSNTEKRETISSLPLLPAERAEFIETAKLVFEAVLDRIEPENPQTTRDLWNPAHYVDNLLLEETMLPISRDYALSLIDAFLVHYVIDLSMQADNRNTG
jgi:hypothetical protein